MEPEQLKEFHTFGVCVCWAAVSGGLAYMVRKKEGEPFLWSEFALHTAASALAGAITYQLLHYWGAPPDLSSALCGVAGWMGTRAMKLMELIVFRRANVKEEELEKKDEDK